MLRLDTYKFHKLDWHLCKPTTCSFCRDSASKQERQHHRKCSQWTLDKRSAFTFWTSHPLKCLPWVHELGRSNLKKLEHAQKNPYFSDGFLRVSTGKTRVSHGLGKVELFPNYVKRRTFQFSLRVSTGFPRVTTGFPRVPWNWHIWAPKSRWKSF